SPSAMCDCIARRLWLTSGPAGDVAAWLKAPAWNACKGYQPFVGSNPTLTATQPMVVSCDLPPAARRRAPCIQQPLFLREPFTALVKTRARRGFFVSVVFRFQEVERPHG